MTGHLALETEALAIADAAAIAELIALAAEGLIADGHQAHGNRFRAAANALADTLDSIGVSVNRLAEQWRHERAA